MSTSAAISPVIPSKSTNWDLCVTCQEDTGERLPDRKNCREEQRHQGYNTLSVNLNALYELNALPPCLSNLARLNDGNGIELALASHSAKWHRRCYVACDKSKVERARKRKSKSNAICSPLIGKLRKNFPSPNCDEPTCFFCDKTINTLDPNSHHAETLSVDGNVRRMATALRDTNLLAKLSSADMPAQDAWYHKQCLTALYTRYKSVNRKSTSNITVVTPESIALAELISYIEDAEENMEGSINHIFKLAHLTQLYTDRLEQLGGHKCSRVNSTRLKEKLLSKIPGLQAYKSKYEVVLSFTGNVGDSLLGASDPNSDTVMLMKAAQIVRKEILQMQYKFKGSLVADEYDILPASLTTLVQMILGGTCIETQTKINDEINSNVLSLTQLLIFNTMKRSRKETQNVRHNVERETCLPLYLGLLIHSKTRKRELIDILFEKGISVSYDRVLEVSTDTANTVIATYERDGVVKPTNMRSGVHTTGNMDNLDYQSKATLAQDEFHGTALSLTQHLSSGETGTALEDDTAVLTEKSKGIKLLPETYTYVPPVAFSNTKPIPSKPVNTSLMAESERVTSDEMQYKWLKNVFELLHHEQVEQCNISWSAYFAERQTVVPKPPALIGLMPLFRDSAHSLAMVKHGMDLIQQATEHLNPGQIPVLTVDQPLYAIAKKIQWSWPSEYGEDRYVILMGGLHIEMAMLNVIGDWLNGSGWAHVMDAAKVTTEGKAEGLQKGSHISRGQWAHQVTAAALYKLQSQAYENTTQQAQLSFFDWCHYMEDRYPLRYWSTVLHLELLFLQFMRSQREGDFLMYRETLGAFIPWMFALDHFHYARWLSIHVTDLMQLPDRCPSAFTQFLKGNFVTQKSCRKFSMMAHDQVHEQLNAVAKGDGGAVGITENEGALRRWMVAGPEIARILNEYTSQNSSKKTGNNHHEQIPSIQKAFSTHVKSTTDIIEELGNPFAEESFDLFTLDTKIMMSEEVVQAIKSTEDIGKTQYKNFVGERLSDTSKPFFDTIHKNNVPLFKSGFKKTSSKPKTKIVHMKSDIELFSRMYISCQTRDGDMGSFFEHENHAWPPSLAENNMARLGTKADLLECLEELAPYSQDTPQVDVKISDGAALVHALEPTKSRTTVKTFNDYVHQVFLPYLDKQLLSVTRLDVIWDVYKPNSLKAYTRQCRGGGQPLRIGDKTTIPGNWKSFLRVDSNKAGLFKYLAHAIATITVPDGKLLITTNEELVLSNLPSSVSQLQPCNHEEADYRMMLHAAHAHRQGNNKVVIVATDTDVVELAIATASVLPGCELWIAFGHGEKMDICSWYCKSLGY